LVLATLLVICELLWMVSAALPLKTPPPLAAASSVTVLLVIVSDPVPTFTIPVRYYNL